MTCVHACVCMHVRTKEGEYQVAVLTVLLHGDETWILEANNVRCFHHYYARIIRNRCLRNSLLSSSLPLIGTGSVYTCGQTN